MNENDNNIRILGEMMRRLQRLALEKDTSVQDIVHEALNGFLLFHETGIDLYNILGGIESGMNVPGHFVTNVDRYNYAVSIKSPIRHIHRPELKYQIVIAQNDTVSIGKMSVILRSHDIYTLQCFSEFVDLWIKLETKYIKSVERIAYGTDVGYFERKVYLPMSEQQVSGQIIGAAISDYIHVFDELLKQYFQHPKGCTAEIEKSYRSHVANGRLKI